VAVQAERAAQGAAQAQELRAEAGATNDALASRVKTLKAAHSALRVSGREAGGLLHSVL
jgi:hypothetical protein